MTSFAPGTNQDYANAYNNWWFNQNGQGPPPQRSSFGPDSRPGQAKAIQPQPQGTPYGQQPKQTSPFTASGQKQQGGPFSAWQTPPSFTPGAGMGNFAYAQPNARPQPFTQQTTDFTGQQADPTQLFAQRDAFVQSINTARAPLAAGAGQGMSGQPPQRDFQQLWGQAGDMAQGGFQNPFSPQPRPQADAIRSLFAQNNIQVPDGFMDQLLGTLGQQAPQSQYLGDVVRPHIGQHAPRHAEQTAEFVAPPWAVRGGIRAWDDPSRFSGPAPREMTPYEKFTQSYESGAPLGDPIWETRRRMGQAAPPENFWQSTNAMPQKIADDQAAARQNHADRQQYLEAETSKRLKAEAAQRRAEPPLPAAFSGKESPAQQAMRGQILHGVQRDASLNSWQLKNMPPEERKAEMRRREAAILAAPPKEIERMHREGRFPTPSKQSQAGYQAARPRHQI